MNLLFHMYLSGNDPEILAGNLMGDFVKGPISDIYPPRIRLGLLLHRKIDSFAQRNVTFQRSRLRLSPRYGLYRGVLVDLFYDHFLSTEWSSLSDSSFKDYIAWAKGIAERHLTIMPEQLQGFVPVIFNDLLPSYQSTAGIESALIRMSRRIKRPNPLAEGGAELTLNYAGLKKDFEQFTSEVQQFSADIIETEASKL